MATEYGDYYDPYGEGFTGKLGELSDGDNNDASGKSPNMPNRSIPKVEIKNSPTAEYGKYYLETFKSLGVLGSKGKRPDNTTPKNDMGQKSPNVVNPAVKKAANIAGETTVEDVLNAKEVAKLSGVSFLKSINKKDQKSPNVWNKKSNLSVTPAYGYHQSGLKKFLFEESAENILTSPNFIVTLNLVPFGFSNVSGLSSNIDTISKYDGGDNDGPYILPTRRRKGTITLKRGVKLVDGYMAMPIKFFLDVGTTLTEITVMVTDKQKNVKKLFVAEGGIITGCSYSELNAASSSLFIRSITIESHNVEEIF